MKFFARIRESLISAIAAGVRAAQPPPAAKPVSGHILLMKIAAARSLLADGLTIEQAAVAVGVEPADLRHFLSPRVRRR